MRYFLPVLFFCFGHSLFAQSYALSDLMATPYLSGLTAASKQSTLLFTANQQGKRNLFMIDGPDQPARQLTQFNEDDGLELTSVSISPDGEWAVFVRGGDHGANSAARPTNAASYISPQKIQLYSVNLGSGELKNLGDGDFPQFHPGSKKIVFINKSQPWIVPADGSQAAKPLFQVSGSVRGMQWNPDGKALAFTTRRGAYSFIGVYNEGQSRIQWISPSFSRDDYARWSPDGKQLAFIRQPASGGALDSLLKKKHSTWSVMVTGLDDENAKEIWKTPATLRGSVPSWQGAFNLNWPVQDRIVFLSYQDGWPHLYTIHPQTKSVQQLTKGKYVVEDISYSSDGSKIAFCANTGNTPGDNDRRHIGIVPVSGGEIRWATSGDGIETSPSFTSNDQSIAYFSNTAQRPLLPTVLKLEPNAKPALQGKELLGNFDYNKLITPKQVSFKSPDGITVYAQMFAPQNASSKSPAIIYVHGGPRRQMYLGWHNMDYYFYDYQTNQYLASLGFVVLSVNYRMGTGYGYEFQHPDNAGMNGASEYIDVLAAGKWLAKQPGVDPKAIGIYGGSYGGYLTAMALGRNSDIFKAGVDIHGVHNRKKKLNEEEYAPDFNDAARIAWESSPSKWVNGWRSPALIIHADDDQNVAFSQSLDLVNRLKTKGVPTEYLVIPDDTHHWLLFSNLVKVKTASIRFLQQQLMKK
jgi:dipeptidyl aminopeptidase/acylaminoacyl peptidase